MHYKNKSTNNSNYSKMEKISIKSKRAQKWLEAYNVSTLNSIEQAYDRPSSAKIEADRKCRERCRRENGYGYRIISAGKLYFTAAWMINSENLRVETARISYIIEL